jgi:hypothetical protein
MTRTRIGAVVCILGAVLAAVACSDGSDGSSEIQRIEDNVAELLEIEAIVVRALDPFAPAPAPPAAPAGRVAQAPCSEVDQAICPGAVLECPIGADVDIVVTDCVPLPVLPLPGDVEVNGTLTYSPGESWPSGSSDVVVTNSSDGNWSYVTTFDNDVTVQVDVEGLDDGTRAVCTGNLETYAADCDILEPPRGAIVP